MALRQLIVFDFDHTIVDANTDTVIWQLAEGGSLPPALMQQRRQLPWTQFVQLTLQHLHALGRSGEEIVRHVGSVPLTPGMADLLQHISRLRNTSVVIISDSNSLFIDRVLTERRLAPLFSRVYTNPASIEPSTARIQLLPYQQQTECRNCSANMCKGAILRQHLASLDTAAAAGPAAAAADGDTPVPSTRVVYVGDGRNDWCAARALNAGDVLCARAGFRLAAMVQSEPDSLRCRVVTWRTADELVPHVQ